MIPALPAVLLALALAAPDAPAAVQAVKPPVFTAGTDVVNVTVSVTDKGGQPVADLRAEDFLVYEDGRLQAIQIFGRGGDPERAGRDDLTLDLGMLVDTSESMLSQLRLSQEAAVRFLNAVPHARELVTIFFDTDIRISRYDSENQQGLFDSIQTTRANGSTALYDAVAAYLSRVHDDSGRKVMLLFTDGVDSTSGLSRGDILDLIRSSRVTIYVIAFTAALSHSSGDAFKSKAFLSEAATLTGGRVFQPTASRDLAVIFDRILDELSAQYVLGFTSDRPAKDGRFRRLKVEVRRKDTKVRHRAGYTPEASER